LTDGIRGSMSRANLSVAFRRFEGPMGVKKDKVRPLAKAQEMRVIASGVHLDPDGAFMTLLRQDPSVARELGAAVERCRRSFDACYPGETRTDTFTPEDWRKKGYEGVAQATELMGLKSY